MQNKFEIFSIWYSHNEDEEKRVAKISGLKETVNTFMAEHLETTVCWLQSTGGDKYSMSTTLTAVIRY